MEATAINLGKVDVQIRWQTTRLGLAERAREWKYD